MSVYAFEPVDEDTLTFDTCNQIDFETVDADGRSSTPRRMVVFVERRGPPRRRRVAVPRAERRRQPQQPDRAGPVGGRPVRAARSPRGPTSDTGSRPPILAVLVAAMLWSTGVDQRGRRGAVRRVPAASTSASADEVETPGEPATPVTNGGGGRSPGAGGGEPGPVCTWEQSGVAGPAGAGRRRAVPRCRGRTIAGRRVLRRGVRRGVHGPGPVGRGRAIPAPAAALPAPEQLASVVRVRLEGTLPAPTVASTPEPGAPALVGYPSFVSVTNWTGVVTDRECDPTGLLCVTVTATPSLRFSPGEPDAPVDGVRRPGGAVRSRRVIRSSRRPPGMRAPIRTGCALAWAAGRRRGRAR